MTDERKKQISQHVLIFFQRQAKMRKEKKGYYSVQFASNQYTERPLEDKLTIQKKLETLTKNTVFT